MFKPVIILVNPSLSANVGSVARAMHNFGFTDLRIVRSVDTCSKIDDAALSCACDGKYILHHSAFYNSISEAAFDINFLFATTARDREMEKEVHTLYGHKFPLSLRWGILFGTEKTGLLNSEISLANSIIYISTANDPLNLAQAVSLCCYEVFNVMNAKKQSVDFIAQNDKLATKLDLGFFFTLLEEELANNNFFQVEEKRPRMMNNIRSIFARSQLTRQEVSTLIGIIRSFKKKV